jgi:WD40 repeat protein
MPTTTSEAKSVSTTPILTASLPLTHSTPTAAVASSNILPPATGGFLPRQSSSSSNTKSSDSSAPRSSNPSSNANSAESSPFATLNPAKGQYVHNIETVAELNSPAPQSITANTLADTQNVHSTAQQHAEINPALFSPKSPEVLSPGARSNSVILRLPAPPNEMNGDIDNENQVKTVFKNLDTGETCMLEDAPNKFPEVVAATNSLPALSLKQLDSQQNRRDSEGELKVNENELAEKKKTLGFLSKIKKVLGGKESGTGGKTFNSVKVKTHNKEKPELNELRVIQSINIHSGPIWTVCVSSDGNYIATGGQDSIVRVWCVAGSAAEKELEQKKQQEAKEKEGNNNTNSSTENNGTNAESNGHVPASQLEQNEVFDPFREENNNNNANSSAANSSNSKSNPQFAASGFRDIVHSEPYRSYSGHKADVIDLAFSKANFLLSASIDKTVRLWHVSRTKCLCLFQHADFVTAVAFHPVEDRYFVSGSFDKKLRIWNIPEHRVIEWAQTSNIITAAAFNPSGTMVCAGLYNGQCVFYQSDGLKYFTCIDCKNRHGKNRKGKKVTGIQFSSDGQRILISTNDSRIRLYSMSDYSMLAKFKGALNDELQIRAYFDDSNQNVITGSENECVYIWSCKQYNQGENNNNSTGSLTSNANKSNQTDKNDSYEYFKATANTVTVAQFLPKPLIKLTETKYNTEANEETLINNDNNNANNHSILGSRISHLICASGYNGELKIFESRQALKRPNSAENKSLTKSQVRAFLK